MKRLWRLAPLMVLLASGAWAQHRGAGGGVRGGGIRGGGIGSPRAFGSGIGNVVFPGGDFAGMRMRGISTGVWFPAYSYWGGYSTFPAYLGYTPFFGGTPLGGAYYSYPYGYGLPPQQPNVIVISGSASGSPYPAAPVVVNQITPLPQRAAPPMVREYPPPGPEPAAAEPGPGSNLYLIALKSGLIQAALAYWVEDGQLHYITRDHKHKQTPLASVDLAFSSQLNRERRVPFRLPPG